MREELLGPKVEGVAVAIVKEIGEENQPIYNSYIINLRDTTNNAPMQGTVTVIR